MNLDNGIQTSVLTEYSDQDAEQIGLLMPQLDSAFDGAPIEQEWLQLIIDSPFHDQLVARDKSGQIVGAATMNIIVGVGFGRVGYLNDFVVSSQLRGQGIGQLLWDGVIEWCRSKDVNLNFTSSPKRQAAHRLYLKNGATIRQTTPFRKKVNR